MHSALHSQVTIQHCGLIVFEYYLRLARFYGNNSIFLYVNTTELGNKFGKFENFKTEGFELNGLTGKGEVKSSHIRYGSDLPNSAYH